MKKNILLYSSCFLFFLQGEFLNAQPWMQPPYFQKNSGDTLKQYNFYEIQKAFNAYEKDHPIKESQINNREPESENENYFPGYMQYKRWEYYMEPRVYPTGDIRIPSRKWEEFQKYLNSDNYKNRISSRIENQSIQSLSGSWTSLGPSAPNGALGIGRINFVRFHPSNNNIIWVGSPSGGLWKSIDGGQTWSTNTDLLTVIGCSDLAIKPSNPNIMYLATGDGDHRDNFSIGVLKSTNGGASWDTTGLKWSVNDGKAIYKLLMNPNNSNILLAAALDGIYKTVDAGVTWTQTQTGYFFTDIEYKPGSPNIVYATSQSGAQFYKSTNGGSSFINITSGLPNSSVVNRFAIGVSPANSNYVYILACNNITNGFYGFYRSTDSGNNFTLQSNSPDIIYYQGWYALSIGVNPLNVNDICVGGLYQWRSADGGVTWAGIGGGSHEDIHALEFMPGTSTVFSGNDGGVFKLDSGNNLWTNLSNGLITSQIYKIGGSETNSNLILAGLQDNVTNLRSSSGWRNVLGGDGMECIIDPIDTNIMYAEKQLGEIWKSTDQFNSSYINIAYTGDTGVNAYGSWVTPYIMHPTNHNTLLVGKSQVYRTTDGGTTWAQLGLISYGSGQQLTALAYAPSNPNYIYVASTSSILNVSTDGMTFVQRNLPSWGCSSIAVSNTDPSKLWITSRAYYTGYQVFFSSDTGITWSNYSTGVPNLPVNSIVYQNNSNDGLYVGTDVGIYFRSNSLTTWQPFFTGLPNVIVDELEINYKAKKIRAATYGRGLWESDLAIPIADFTSNSSTVCKGSTVTFTDQSSGSPSNWNWSFSGGNPLTSSLQNPSVVYNTVGIYNVSLTVTNAHGSHTKTVSSFITVNSLPPATVTPQGPTNFCIGGSVILAANTGGGLNYQWKKGSTILSGATFQTYTATSTGSYKVIVTNSNSCSRTSSAIAVTAPPSTTITVNGSLTFCLGDSVTFTVPTGTGYLFQWKTNNVNILGATSQSYTAKNAGIYKVIVTNSFGCSKTSAPKTVSVPCREGETIAGKNFVKAFPIPVHDILQLDIKDFAGKGWVRVLNESGQIIIEKEMDFEAEGLKNIDMSKLASGMYTVIVEGKENKEIIKVIKD